MCPYIVSQHAFVSELCVVACAFASVVWHHQALLMTQVCKVSRLAVTFTQQASNKALTFKIYSWYSYGFATAMLWMI